MERELDEAANWTALYFLAVHSGKPGFVLKTKHLKDVCRHGSFACSTQHLNGHSVLQLFDDTPHRAFDSWRGQPTHSFLLAGF